MTRALIGFVSLVIFVSPAVAQIQVTSTAPARNAVVVTSSTISVTFDRALDTATIGAASFRAFGSRTGPIAGTYSFSNSNQTATLTPSRALAAGEVVAVNLSHDIKGADTTTLRAAGYATQFSTGVTPSAGSFTEIDTFSNRDDDPQTRIYGAAATDLNGDGWTDLATVNEVSSDVRVFLNTADGSGLYGPMLAPEPIGLEASPNEPADFNNDGIADLCTSAADGANVTILLGAGDGTFSSSQTVALGGQPHGIAVLDVDGDGDLDIVDANVGSNNLALLINNGAGVFGSPTTFEGGVDGEYGLVSADMNGDGITDLVVGGRNGSEINTMLGNGNGTFTAAGPAEPSGGNTWVIALGDVDGDGELDVAAANDGSANVGILTGKGDGTFNAVVTLDTDNHTPSVDLGDLDGDGDLDIIASSFGGGYWRRFENDGNGNFSFVEDFPAPSNPSCSILLDVDNDGDLDMALTDEIADVIVLMRNGAAAPSPCTPAPSACRTPTLPGKAKLQIKDKSPDDRDSLSWKWTKGQITPKGDFGNPVTTDGYNLCLYEDGALLRGFGAPAGGICRGKACWRDLANGFSYGDKDATPDGLVAIKLSAGTIPGKAKITVKGKGGHLGLPDLTQLTGVLDVQLQKETGSPCWGATFSPPYQKNDGSTLKAISDDPATVTTTTTSSTTTTLPPVWSAIHAQVIGPTCSGCHGGSGGLSGLNDCDTAHANLVNVPSTELPTMDRVEPGSPTTSWLMHKLDGDQGTFTGSCPLFCGSSMPLGGPLLDPDVRNAIRTWITNGAVNDCW